MGGTLPTLEVDHSFYFMKNGLKFKRVVVELLWVGHSGNFHKRMGLCISYKWELIQEFFKWYNENSYKNSSNGTMRTESTQIKGTQTVGTKPTDSMKSVPTD